MNILLAFVATGSPEWLAASQWTLLLGLAALVIVMYRQLSYVLHLGDLGTEREGLAVGTSALPFEYAPVNKGTETLIRFSITGAWSFLLFADPGCVSCQTAMTALEELAPRLRKSVRILVLTSADPEQIMAVESFSAASVDLGHVSREVPDELYRTHATPFGYLIDSEGIVQAKGIAASASAIRALTSKADRRAVSIVSSSL